ncbi:MAG TPA: hypothetical protein VMV69_15275 [Pirellulales bacterium]|nr:hypothetical protein [Pirellulales bacterium]
MARSRRRGADGKITRGIDRHALVERTIEFVATQLPLWRDDPKRASVEAEEQLNSQLCKFLAARARCQFPMASFHHEERQGKRRRVDMSAGPTLDAIEAASYLESIYVPFLVMEGKRIPAPAAARRREYITGFAERCGGMQRFKLGLHGAKHETAVMIGYVQANESAFWWETINQWIGELARSDEDPTCAWKTSDQLEPLLDRGAAQASRCESHHARTGARKPGVIRLVHLWLRMNPTGDHRPTPSDH